MFDSWLTSDSRFIDFFIYLFFRLIAHIARCILYTSTCIPVIMDHLVNNSAEGRHCTSVSHENSFSLCCSFSLSLSCALCSPRAILTKQFHLSPSTRSVSICTADIKSWRRETDSNVLESPAMYSVNYFFFFFFFTIRCFCHRANGVQLLILGDR